jgi:hypothetical protein
MCFIILQAVWRRKGRGLSFLYYAPSANIVSVPMASVNIPFVFTEPTADFQTVTVQGQMTYRIIEPKQASTMLDFTIHAQWHYRSDQYQKIPERLVYGLQTLVRAKIQRLPLREALIRATKGFCLWCANRLLSRHSQASIVAGTVRPKAPLALESQMPTGGVIFSDGVEADHLDFNSGAIANIQVAPEKANLVIA